MALTAQSQNGLDGLLTVQVGSGCARWTTDALKSSISWDTCFTLPAMCSLYMEAFILVSFSRSFRRKKAWRLRPPSSARIGARTASRGSWSLPYWGLKGYQESEDKQNQFTGNTFNYCTSLQRFIYRCHCSVEVSKRIKNLGVKTKSGHRYETQLLCLQVLLQVSTSVLCRATVRTNWSPFCQGAFMRSCLKCYMKSVTLFNT